MIRMLRLIKTNFEHPQVKMIITIIVVVAGLVSGSFNALDKYLNKTNDRLTTLQISEERINERINNSYQVFATKQRMLKDFDYTKKDLLELREDVKNALLTSAKSEASLSQLEKIVFFFCRTD